MKRSADRRATLAREVNNSLGPEHPSSLSRSPLTSTIAHSNFGMCFPPAIPLPPNHGGIDRWKTGPESVTEIKGRRGGANHVHTTTRGAATQDAANAPGPRVSGTPRIGIPRMAATGGQTPGWPLHTQTFGWLPNEADGPQALALTYWFDAAPEGDPYDVKIHFSGHRADRHGRRGPRDRFDIVANVDRVIPGSGQISLTVRLNVTGRWRVKATPIRVGDQNIDRRMRTGTITASTAYAPVMRIRAPGVRLGAWPAFVAAGSVAALFAQTMLAGRSGLPAGTLLLISLLACLTGIVGAKVYFLATNRGEGRGPIYTGMCVQGFVLAAIGTMVIGALLAGIPVGQTLDVTAPGLLFGMAVGRLGCFFGGCCAGRPTASRWGLWSSDKRLGVKRIPVQLLESAFAAIVGLATLLIIWGADRPFAGLVFVAAIASYTFGRQMLFPLRGLPRQSVHGRLIVMAVAGLVALMSIISAIVVSR